MYVCETHSQTETESEKERDIYGKRATERGGMGECVYYKRWLRLLTFIDSYLLIDPGSVTKDEIVGWPLHC